MSKRKIALSVLFLLGSMMASADADSQPEGTAYGEDLRAAEAQFRHYFRNESRHDFMERHGADESRAFTSPPLKT